MFKKFSVAEHWKLFVES